VFLVRDFGIPEERAGYSVGWIASSFALAQFCTGKETSIFDDYTFSSASQKDE